MYTVNKLKNVTRVNKNNIDFLIQEQGKFYIQDTSNKYCSGDNFIETDSIRESMKSIIICVMPLKLPLKRVL